MEQTEEQKEAKITMVCSHCGGDDIRFDASGYWSIDKQEFMYELSYDYEYCGNCASECRSTDAVWEQDRWNNVVAKGDLVNFHPDRMDYSDLDGLDNPGRAFDWASLDTALGLVVSDEGELKGKYGERRETVIVRLFTGEDIEVWPRDLIVVGQMESGWELFGEKGDEAQAA